MTGMFVCAVVFSPALLLASLSRESGAVFPIAFLSLYVFFVLCGYSL